MEQNIRSIYQEFVTLRFHILKNYLPFAENISTFQKFCTDGINQGITPQKIIEKYFQKFSADAQEEEKTKQLQQLVETFEKCKVLITVLETIAYQKWKQCEGFTDFGTWESLKGRIEYENEGKRAKELFQSYTLKLVFDGQAFCFSHQIHTIEELFKKSVISDQFLPSGEIVQQLGKSEISLEKMEKSLEIFQNHFLQSVEDLQFDLALQFQKNSFLNFTLRPHIGLSLGNPNDSKTLAKNLKKKILFRYRKQIEELSHWITFKGLNRWFVRTMKKLDDTLSDGENGYHAPYEFFRDLLALRDEVVEKHQGLHEEKISKVLSNIRLYGFHLASLDFTLDALEIRNESPKVDEMIGDIAVIQNENGIRSVERLLIANPHHPMDLLRVLKKSEKELPLHLVPLFSQFEAIGKATHFMSTLYNEQTYRSHLKQKNGEQYIGFDFYPAALQGGLLPTLWEIFKAKEVLFELSKHQGIALHFYEGLGRYNDWTPELVQMYHKQASQHIPIHQLDIGLSGANLERFFADPFLTQYHLSRLFAIGIEENLFPPIFDPLSAEDRQILEEMMTSCHKKYLSLPHKEKLASWIPIYSHYLNPNLQGFYGIGTALQILLERGNLLELQSLIKRSPYCTFLLWLVQRSLDDPFIPMAKYFQEEQDGPLWKAIDEEYQLTKKNLAKMNLPDTLPYMDAFEKEAKAFRSQFLLPALILHHCMGK